MKLTTLNAGILALLLGSASLAQGHSLIVDLDPGTPGFQTSLSVLPGTVVTADIHLVDDGVTPISGYGLATNFNDVPGTVGILAPTFDGGAAAAVLVPTDLATGFPIAPGGVLGPVGTPPFGIGPGGPFTGTDFGAGLYDLAGLAWVGMPGLGGTIILETIVFSATGTPGSVTDIAPLGILTPGAPGGPALPPIAGPGGVEFYNAAVGGSYGAAPFLPGANPLFPAGTPAIMPGTVTITPEPGAAMLALLGMVSLFLRRRR